LISLSSFLIYSSFSLNYSSYFFCSSSASCSFLMRSYSAISSNFYLAFSFNLLSASYYAFLPFFSLIYSVIYAIDIPSSIFYSAASSFSCAILLALSSSACNFAVSYSFKAFFFNASYIFFFIYSFYLTFSRSILYFISSYYFSF